MRLERETGAVEVLWGEVLLLRYVYGPRPPEQECAKPFAHPVRTLTGEVVTALRPRDHRWHTGLFLGFSKVGGQNFWGGPSWVPGEGWVQLDNVGSIRHEDWERLETTDTTALLAESLEWRTRAEERWLSEHRVMEIGGVDEASGAWALRFESVLSNVAGRDLPLGHPASAGLTGYAYGGLTWRGPRAFETDSVYFTHKHHGPAVHGTHAPWLAFCGEHDEHDGWSTVIFVDDPENPRHPSGWSVWTGDFVQVSCAFHVDGEYVIPAGGTLRLRYTLVFADGAWGPEEVTRYVAELE